jgi:hypothetical protein
VGDILEPMRTINDIVPPSKRQDPSPLSSPAPRSPRSAGSSHPFPFKTLLAVLIVIALSLGALYYFSSAKVEVTPNTVSAAIQNSFTATAGSGELPYQLISVQKVASQSVKSTGTKVVSTSASGQITIYNTQSKSQKLIATTRFATTAGLIFRIHDAVTVPGGTTAKPGTVKATVYADKPGDAYNVGATSFTIPGFAGTPLASQVYARSTSVMTGGASGNVPVVSPTDEAQAQKALSAALAPDLAKSLSSQVPSGYILLPGAATTTYTEVASATSTTPGQVDIKEQGTMTAVVFPNTALAKAVATSVAGLGYQGEPVSLLPASNLSLSTVALPTADAASFSFTLAGTASLEYVVDSTRIAAAVAGKTRSAAEVALTNYPEVKRAIIILRPFWRQTFPEDPATITVTVANP